MSENDFEELGVKVRRAQRALAEIRGVGTADGIEVVVDAENHLLSISLPEAEAVLAAFAAAVADKRERVEAATRELREDERVEAASTFLRANAALVEAERAQRDSSESYDDLAARGSGWSETSY
ncbi:hypothetical protein ACWDSJ_04605 [Nocardia sp. NPDC003482]